MMMMKSEDYQMTRVAETAVSKARENETCVNEAVTLSETTTRDRDDDDHVVLSCLHRVYITA